MTSETLFVATSVFAATLITFIATCAWLMSKIDKQNKLLIAHSKTRTSIIGILLKRINNPVQSPIENYQFMEKLIDALWSQHIEDEQKP